MPHKAVKITVMSCLLRKNIITFLSSMAHIAEWREKLGEALEVFGLTFKKSVPFSFKVSTITVL